MFKNIPLHWQILTGLILGFIFGFLSITFNWGDFVNDFIGPFGTIFIDLLMLIAIPLVITSLIVGVASLNDVRKLSRMGGKTIGLYVGMTALAVTMGLVTVNIIDPGSYFTEERREEMRTEYDEEVDRTLEVAEEEREEGPLAPLVRIVPSNIFGAMTDNANMLQIVFFSLFLGVTLVMIGEEKRKPVVNFFEGLNSAIIQMVSLIMKIAPIGVFALIAEMMVDYAGDDPASALDFLAALGMYGLTVIAGLAIMVGIIYPSILRTYAQMPYSKFFKGIFPAQMLAFSTSSSAATLPVTMQRCENNLGVGKEVSGFVLPLGATINMDGTSLYQAVAAVFIATALGFDLTIFQQVTIVLTATLASIGTAGVPGAGIVMLVIVLQSVGLDAAGIGLILAVDRPLDMLRTTVNVTGDATVSSVIAFSEGTLNIPENE